MNPTFDSDSSIAVSGHSINKQYADHQVLKSLDIEIPKGSLYALLGPNGAGKSTLIGLLSGVFLPDSGDINVLGYDPSEQPLEVKRRIGMVPEELALFERLTGMQQLVFCGRMYGLESSEAESRAKELLDLINLEQAQHQLIATYSKGMRRRLAIATALIHSPPVVFLDEPFDGIDVLASRVIRDLLEALLHQGVTILLTTHILEVADRLATYAGVLNHGKIQDQGTKQALLQRYDSSALEGVFQQLVPQSRAVVATPSFYLADEF